MKLRLSYFPFAALRVDPSPAKPAKAQTHRHDDTVHSHAHVTVRTHTITVMLRLCILAPGVPTQAKAELRFLTMPTV